MKQFVMAAAMVCTLATSMVAQTTPTTPRTGNEGRGGGRGPFRGLNLTAAQQEQANAIFEAQRQAAEPVRTQLETAETALYDAAKRNAGDAELDRLAQAEAPLLAQLEAIRAKAFARFYAILTPDQREIIDSASGRGGPGAFGRFLSRPAAPGLR
jgi:Spy/CpxP family protein refolding chaperone